VAITIPFLPEVARDRARRALALKRFETLRGPKRIETTIGIAPLVPR
jgi:hypothetical protein